MARFGLVVVMAMALTACAPHIPLQRAQVAAISRDTNPAELDRILAKATPVSEFEFDANNGRFLARNYNLQTGMQSSGTMVCTPACIYIPITVPVLTQYVVVQKLPSRSVFAWGTLEELSKDSDDAVSGIMPILKQRLQQESDKKRQVRNTAEAAGEP